MFSANDIRICVPLNEKTLTDLIAAAQRAALFGDVIELRLDGLDRGQVETASAEIKTLVSKLQRPVILTFRPAEQGGYRHLTKNQRVTFWQDYFQSEAAYFDVEFDLLAQLTNYEAEEQPDWSRVICSHHDFSGVPANLEELYEQLAFTPARILKLACQANDIVDCLPLFNLMERARREEREIIALAMGEAGLITRILGPSRGVFLTYGAAEPEKGTAAGQLLARDLKNVYRIDKINSETMITGLVGSPVAQSVSPHMHNAAFEASGLDGVYVPFQVADLPSFMKRMVHPRSRELEWNLKGLSITAPHKRTVMKLLDSVDQTALSIGAVNTVFLENEQLSGYNTDAEGFITPLLARFGSLSGARVAVIGAGGAASAAVFALQQQQADITLYARNLEKAQAISERFRISYDALSNAKFSSKEIVINTTPLGSFGEHIDETPATSDQLNGTKLAYDLVYNPRETRFMREARMAGCEVLGGLEMLAAQALLQFKLWTNTDASYELMHAAGSSALREKFHRP